MVASGPDVPDDAFYDALLTALFEAKKRIWIATPYFVPDETLARALVLAAKRGVDVRILVPARSNHWVADLVAASYMRQVRDAGGRLCLYRGGMMHAKVSIIDNQVATVGSANMDIRSLFLNYEIALFLYSEPDIDRLANWYESVLADCDSKFSAPTALRTLAEDLARLVAPIT
jgi:cardiolipin synthase